jgi:hypothetical protein
LQMPISPGVRHGNKEASSTSSAPAKLSALFVRQGCAHRASGPGLCRERAVKLRQLRYFVALAYRVHDRPCCSNPSRGRAAIVGQRTRWSPKTAVSGSTGLISRKYWPSQIADWSICRKCSPSMSARSQIICCAHHPMAGVFPSSVHHWRPAHAYALRNSTTVIAGLACSTCSRKSPMTRPPTSRRSYHGTRSVRQDDPTSIVKQVAIDADDRRSVAVVDAPRSLQSNNARLLMSSSIPCWTIP